MAKAAAPAAKKAAPTKAPKAPKAPKIITPQNGGESPKEPTPPIKQDEGMGGEGQQLPTPPNDGAVEDNAAKGLIDENASDDAGGEEKDGGVNGPANIPAETETKEPDWAAELKARYKSKYPNAKELHITSDSQIFLDSNKEMAKEHAAKLKNKQVLVLPL